jgi:hypothetical protein
VHSVPVGVQGMLLAAVLGVVGVQTVGAATSVGAVPYDKTVSNCALAPTAQLQKDCRVLEVQSNTFLPVGALFSMLRSAGLDPKTLNLNPEGLTRFGQEDFVDVGTLTDTLLNNTSYPLKLQGEKNPTLTVGNASVVLGTPEQPLLARNILGWAVFNQLKRRFHPDNGVLGLSVDANITPHGSVQTLTGLQAGRYALVTVFSAPWKTSFVCTPNLTIHLVETSTGSLMLCDTQAKFQIVTSPEALVSAQRAHRSAVLLYKLGPVNDLRNLPLTLVNTSKLKIVTQ